MEALRQETTSSSRRRGAAILGLLPALLGALPALLAAPEAGPAAGLFAPEAGGPAALRAQGPVRFADAAAAAGVDFSHRHGGTGERYMVETMGGGVAVADLDVDGALDVYLVQSGPTPGYRPERPLRDAWLRNRGDGTFADAGLEAGLGAARGDGGARGYGMGVAAADYDDDGFPDLYLTAFGPDALYRNNGDGTFAEVTEAAGVGAARWGVSAAWADVDRDGDLDLYVTNYVDFDWDHHVFCGNARRGIRSYCHPDVYDGVADVLYRNNGDGTFADVAEAAGVANAVEGKGLGVVFGDFDDDGDADIYVANDSTRNFLYVNRGDGTFADEGLMAGVGYSDEGKAEAGMGTDWGDYDGDGRLDVVVTNLDLETNTLYRNLGDGLFADQTFASGLAEPSLRYVGFGANWLDYDHDGDLDLFVANGHIIDNIELFNQALSYAQPNHLYRNEGGGRFVEVHHELGAGFALSKVSRGSAVGDLDADGDPDIVVANNDQPADLLRNDGGEAAGGWLQVRLVGVRDNRTAAGARLWVAPRPEGAGQTRRQLAEVRAGSSYASSSDPALHFGLGTAARASVTVRWPDGTIEELGTLEANHRYVVRQGRGVVARRGPRRPR